MLGKRIKELRRENGLTQEALGKLINVTKVSVCCYESGTRTPTLDTLQKLSDYFGKDISYFLGNDEYVVADGDVKYGRSMSREEIEFIEEIRKISKLYSKMIEDPKRFVQLIDKKIG